MNPNKNNLRGLKRKFKDKDEEDDHLINDKPKFKLKDENDKKCNDFSILDISNNHINNLNNDSKNLNQNLVNDFFADSSCLDKSFNELCNSDQSSQFSNYNSNNFEINSVNLSSSNNLLNNNLQSDDSINEFETNQFVINTEDDSSKENLLLDYNTNENFLITTKEESSKTNNQTFNTFLNSSLNNCYVNRPVTPLPQLDFQQPLNQSNCENQESFDSFIKSTDFQNKFNQTTQNQPSFNNQTNLNNKQLNEENSVFSPLNSFPTLIANTKFFNPSSSSLFNAAAIVDTYYSSSNKKIKLEKAKNINHFRYLLFNKSLAKLNKFCNSSDPDIRNSVLVCNTLKRLERQLRKENIYLHLCPTGLAFVKLKEKQNLDQLDYSNLFFDKNSQIYYEINEDEKNSNEKTKNDVKKVPNIDFSNLCIKPYVEFENNSLNISDNLNQKQSLEFKSENLENFLDKNFSEHENSSFISSTVTLSTQYFEEEKSKSDSLLGNLLRCETLNEPSSTVSNDKPDWPINNDQNQFNWTNMISNLSLCKETNLPLNDEVEQKNDDENLMTYMNSYNLFNSTDSNLITDNLLINNPEQPAPTSCVNEEIFSDIDLNLYDFDLLPPTINGSINKNLFTNQNFLTEDQNKNKNFKESENLILCENEDALSSSSLFNQKLILNNQDSLNLNDQNSSSNISDQNLSVNEDNNFNSKLDSNSLFYMESNSSNFSDSAISLSSLNNSNSCGNSISNNTSSTSFTNNQSNKITPISS